MAVQVVNVWDRSRAPWVERVPTGYRGRRYFWVTTTDPGKGIIEASLPQYGDAWSAQLPSLLARTIRVEYALGPGVGTNGLDEAGRCLVTIDYETPSGGGNNEPPPAPGTKYTLTHTPLSVPQLVMYGKTKDSTERINNGDGVTIEHFLPQYEITSVYAAFPNSQRAVLDLLLAARAVNNQPVVLPNFKDATVGLTLPTNAGLVMSYSLTPSATVHVLKVVVAFSPATSDPKMPGSWEVGWEQENESGKATGVLFATRPHISANWTGFI